MENANGNPSSAVSPQCWEKSELLKKLLLQGLMGNLEAVPRRYGKGVRGLIPYTPVERETNFWASLNYSEFGCWNWKRCQDENGYGRFRWPGDRSHRSNRISWRLTRGAIPIGLFVCHKCDNPLCARPDHLFLGTQDENMKDMTSKQRSFSQLGSLNGHAKLGDDDVRTIRTLAGSGFNFAELGRMFSVTKECIGLIVRRQTWKNIQ